LALQERFRLIIDAHTHDAHRLVYGPELLVVADVADSPSWVQRRDDLLTLSAVRHRPLTSSCAFAVHIITQIDGLLAGHVVKHVVASRGHWRKPCRREIYDVILLRFLTSVIFIFYPLELKIDTQLLPKKTLPLIAVLPHFFCFVLFTSWKPVRHRRTGETGNAAY